LPGNVREREREKVFSSKEGKREREIEKRYKMLANIKRTLT
jgi:hypothetical protein